MNICSPDTHSQNERSHGSGIPGESQAHGFAVSATGDGYPIYEPSCACTLKFGQKLSPLGRVDGDAKAGDVAVAVDPATGHLYADDQSSVAEWDTGAMNRNSVEGHEPLARWSRASARRALGHLRRGWDRRQRHNRRDLRLKSRRQPGRRQVYVFASDAPAVTAGEPTGVTEKTASLSGAVDPRGVAISECMFEYGLTDEFGNGPYNHSVPCKQTPGEIGAGSNPVAVSAQLEGLEPGELYHFRLVATNANGSGEGSGMLATRGVGFGIKSYEISFLNENGTPDMQAGSHPYKFVDLFTLNSHFKRKNRTLTHRTFACPTASCGMSRSICPPASSATPMRPPQTAPDSNSRLILGLMTVHPDRTWANCHLSWSENRRVNRCSKPPSSPSRPCTVWLCSSAPLSSYPCCTSTMVFLQAAITPCR